MKNRLIETKNKDSFLKLLLDENLCSGTIFVPKKWVREAGGLHPKIRAKRKYELLLRIAVKHGFTMELMEETDTDGYIALGDQSDEPFEALKTDCYVIAKYSEILQKSGYFDAAVSGIIEQGRLYGKEEELVSYLEQMLGRKEKFDSLEEAISPVLIYKGSGVCNNMLNVFSEQLGKALEEKGYQVEYFDAQKEPLENLTKYIGRYFKAIFGVQTYLFQVKMADERTYLHEKIKGPKFHLILDHPIWMKQQLTHEYEDFYVLSHDRNYVHFVEKEYGKHALHFPIPGMEHNTFCGEKRYGITFVGSMGDYRKQLQSIREMSEPDRYLANRFLLIMRKEKKLSADKAFEKAFAFYKDKYTGENVIDVFYRMRKVIYVVMDYYRYQILKTILDGGIRLDVFGEFWENSVFKDNPNLVCHPSITVEKSLEVFSQSKMSLNVMSWHKDGFTERMANILLSDTVLVTDWTSYLEENYEKDKELLMFDLDTLDELPRKIKDVLEDDEKQKMIAEAGYRKTLQKHTWSKRTEELLEFLETLG